MRLIGNRSVAFVFSAPCVACIGAISRYQGIKIYKAAFANTGFNFNPETLTVACDIDRFKTGQAANDIVIDTWPIAQVQKLTVDIIGVAIFPHQVFDLSGDFGALTCDQFRDVAVTKP